MADGYEIYTALLDEPSRIAYAAANVLACLKVRLAQTSRLLLDMLQNESRSLYRAGLVLLIGQNRHDSAESRGVVNAAAKADSVEERRAAAIAVARLSSVSISTELRNALTEVICEEDLCQYFEGLP